MTTLELDAREMMALLLLLKVGMDYYTNSDAASFGEAIGALDRVPNPVIDRLIAKVSLAGGKAANKAA